MFPLHLRFAETCTKSWWFYQIKYRTLKLGFVSVPRLPIGVISIECFSGKVCGVIGSYLDYLEEIMFFSAQFFRVVLLFSFGGVVIVIAVAILKIWENRESVLREIRRQIDSNKARQPEENDERFDYEGESYDSNENIFFYAFNRSKVIFKRYHVC